MTAYIIRRGLQAIFIVFLVTLIVFLAVRLLPGDPAKMLLSRSDYQTVITEEALEKIRADLGLDRPLLVQYVSWITDLLQGEFGESFTLQLPVAAEMKRRIPVSLYLGMLSFIIGIVVGIPMGIICALKRGTWVDTVVTMLANVGITIPVFWLALMLVYIFSVRLGWLPVFGYTSPFDDFWLSIKQIIMPLICLSVFPIAGCARQTRSSVLEVMQQDYIRTALCKGLPQRLIVYRHMLKNALIPVITLQGLSIGAMLGGQVLIETVYGIPGMGRFVVEGINGLDYMVVQGTTVVIATAVVFANLLVDISYGWFDPRIRYGD